MRLFLIAVFLFVIAINLDNIATDVDRYVDHAVGEDNNEASQ